MKRDDDDWLEDEPAGPRPRRRNALPPVIVAAIIGAVAVIAASIIGSPPTQRGEVPPASQASPPPPSTIVNFIILDPADRGAVGLRETVSGRTPHVGAKHYVVVTPVQTGQPYIQWKANVSDQGTWSSTAQFGEGRNGYGEEFIVYAIATNEELRPGPKTRSINVLGESPHITVRRTKN